MTIRVLYRPQKIVWWFCQAVFLFNSSGAKEAQEWGGYFKNSGCMCFLYRNLGGKIRKLKYLGIDNKFFILL